MIDDRYYVEPADWIVDQADLRAIRNPVFVVERGIAMEQEWDAFDARARHLLARDTQGRAIGTARLAIDGTIGHVGVLAHWRGQGVGTALLNALIASARELGHAQLQVRAFPDAVGFFSRFGFIAAGERSPDAAEPNPIMRRALPPLTPPPAPGAVAATRSRRRDLLTLEQAQQALDELVAAAKHRLWIYSRDLDQQLLDRIDCLDAIKRVALSGRGAEVRILFQDASSALQSGHRLLHLARRVPSFVQLRKPLDAADLQYPSAFVLNDQGGYLFRPIASRWDGECDTHGPARNRPLLEYFEQVWERSGPDPELRQMSL